METHSNDDIVLSANLPSDQSERKATSVAEAALQDGRKATKTNRVASKNWDVKTLLSLGFDS